MQGNIFNRSLLTNPLQPENYLHDFKTDRFELHENVPSIGQGLLAKRDYILVQTACVD